MSNPSHKHLRPPHDPPTTSKSSELHPLRNGSAFGENEDWSGGLFYITTRRGHLFTVSWWPFDPWSMATICLHVVEFFLSSRDALSPLVAYFGPPHWGPFTTLWYKVGCLPLTKKNYMGIFIFLHCTVVKSSPHCSGCMTATFMADSIPALGYFFQSLNFHIFFILNPFYMIFVFTWRWEHALQLC